MKPIILLLAIFLFALTAVAQNTNVAAAPEAQQSPAPRVVDLKAPDGALLKATYFAAAKSGPGVLLYQQSNRTRQSWDDVARQLAAAGINTLTVDSRAHGESGGKYDNWTAPNWKEVRKQWWPGDLAAEFQYLITSSSHPVTIWSFVQNLRKRNSWS